MSVFPSEWAPYAVTFENGEKGHIIGLSTGNFNFDFVQRICSERAVMVNTCGNSPLRVKEHHYTYCLLPDYHPVHKLQQPKEESLCSRTADK